MLELVFPMRCGGCGAPGVRLCATCMQAWRGVPERISTLIDAHVPVWSMGPYGGARRRCIIAFKERGRYDLAGYIGAATEHAVAFLIARGEVDEDVLLVPAPTRPESARARGGDHVERALKRTRFHILRAVQHGVGVAESVGLDVAGRRRNLSGKVQLRVAPGQLRGQGVVVVDDVITTGATMAETVLVLLSAGALVRGCLGWSNA